MRQFLTNESGERTAIVLPLEEYEELLELAEDAIALKEAGEALAAIERGDDELVPWEQIKRERRERREEQAKPGGTGV